MKLEIMDANGKHRTLTIEQWINYNGLYVSGELEGLHWDRFLATVASFATYHGMVEKAKTAEKFALTHDCKEIMIMCKNLEENDSLPLEGIIENNCLTLTIPWHSIRAVATMMNAPMVSALRKCNFEDAHFLVAYEEYKL